ncbi:unnamed protein product [Ixodes pacificus]
MEHNISWCQMWPPRTKIMASAFIQLRRTSSQATTPKQRGKNGENLSRCTRLPVNTQLSLNQHEGFVAPCPWHTSTTHRDYVSPATSGSDGRRHRISSRVHTGQV